MFRHWKSVSLLLVVIMVFSLVPTFCNEVYASQHAPGQYQVNTPRTGSLNLRRYPNTNSQILASVPHNTILNVTEIRGSWGRVTFHNHVGWISLDHAIRITSTVSQPSSNNTFRIPMNNSRITQSFGAHNRNRQAPYVFHTGEDRVSNDRNILAAGRGVVVAARNTGGANQGIVVIRHNIEIRGTRLPVYSFYAHLSRIDVSVNQQVSTGQVIGQMGSHLHHSFVCSFGVGGDYWGYARRIENDGNSASRGGFTFINPAFIRRYARLV